MLEAADTLEKELHRKYEEKSESMRREFQEATEQIQSLDEENKRLLDTLVRHSKGKASGIMTGGEILRSASSSSMGMS